MTTITKKTTLLEPTVLVQSEDGIVKIYKVNNGTVDLGTGYADGITLKGKNVGYNSSLDHGIDKAIAVIDEDHTIEWAVSNPTDVGVSTTKLVPFSPPVSEGSGLAPGTYVTTLSFRRGRNPEEIEVLSIPDFTFVVD